MKKLNKLLFVICIQFYIFQLINGLSINMINTGCSSYDCKRNCMSPDIQETPGDNGFKIVMDDIIDKKYIPNRTYKLTITSNKIRNTVQEFRGFLITAVPDAWYDAMEFHPMGKFKIKANDSDVRYAVGCSEMVTHANFESKTHATVYWTAPPVGSGCVSLKLMIIQTDTLWFKDDGELTQTLCEEVAIDNESHFKPCCACGEAKYTMTFKGTWSRSTHPKDWPENEWLTHWANVIGAVHTSNYTVWEYGGYASAGLKDLAEFGITTTLEAEIKNHTRYGDIRNILVAQGLWYPNINQETSAVFTTSNTHNLLSLASMLGPSPDWLGGVSKLNLCLPNCTWIENYSEDLYPIDAGTDSGLSYNSPNRPTLPQEKIFRITSSYPNNIKSPFYDPSGKQMKPVAKLMIKRQLLKGAQCPNGIRESNVEQTANLDNFEPRDFSDPIIRDKILNDQIGSKRKNIKDISFLDTFDPRCMTTDWTEWTECSSSCGNGIRKRNRQYKNPRAPLDVCNELLEDNEMCLSKNGECDESTTNEDYHTADMCLMVTSWSAWSPCSVTCGTGFTVRVREYINKDLEKSCNTKLVDNKQCKSTDGKSKKCRNNGFTNDPTERMRICSLDVVPGPCRKFVNSTRYYYNKDKKMCMEFDYGGCKGNENNFETIDKCNKMCSIMTDTVKAMPVDEDTNMKMKQKEMCMLPKEEGTCLDSIQRYYFDRTKLECAPLDYSGCGGNDNNFASMTECHKNCDSVLLNIKENPLAINRQLTIPEKKRICMSQEQRGNCGESIKRFAYSVNMGKCLEFDYSGCDGNQNNFETIKECEMTCDILIQMTKQSLANEEKSDDELKNKETCMQPKEIGPCIEYIEKYYFDSKTGKCESFQFGGCNPNDNNFDSMSDCESTCKVLYDQKNSNALVPIMNFEKGKIGMKERKFVCRLPAHEGVCDKLVKRYYFNAFNRECEPFGYTGCGGNENNFLTPELCRETCSNIFDDDSESLYDADMKLNFHPIDCVLSDWSNWTDCTNTQCGQKGKSYRFRQIIVQPQYGGEECRGNLNETRACFNECESNTDEAMQTDCTVGKWSLWSECKQITSCQGFQERKRPVLQMPKNGGSQCPKLREKRRCYIGKCIQ